MKKHHRLLCLFAAIIAAAGYLTFENTALTVTEYKFSSLNIPAGFEGFKILHLSDLHVKRSGKSYSSLLKLVKEQAPDIIIISGDLIDHRVVNVNAATALAEKLCSVAPVYYVTGNHEESLPGEIYISAMEKLRKAGVCLLDSRRETIERDGESIFISGMFDFSLLHTETAKKLLDNEGLNLFVFHRPQHGCGIAELGADLSFSGHAHGGQMQIPFVGGLIAPDQGFFPKYSEGMHWYGDKAEVISRGIGNSLIPFRVNNRPEIVIVTLTAEKGTKSP